MCNCKYALLYQCICIVFAYVIYMPTYRINLYNTRTYVYHFFEKKKKKKSIRIIIFTNQFYKPIVHEQRSFGKILDLKFKLGKLTLRFSALRLFPNKRIC